MASNEEQIDHCEEILEKIGNGGYFHKMFKRIYVFGFSFCAAMTAMNFILALHAPDHWCHVPGREATNFTLDQWRTLTLPTEVDSMGEMRHSTCSMYNFNTTELLNLTSTNWNQSNTEIGVKSCTNGYEYDKTWYERTIVTQEDWVCERDLYVTHTYTISRIAEMIGTFVFGQLADTVGRRMVFVVTAVFVVLGRVLSILTSGNFIIFSISAIITSLTINSIFLSPPVIAMEISKEENRANIAMTQNLGWSFGACTMPLLFWYLGDWQSFLWLTTLPIAGFCVFYKFMIESPRWLISRRRFKDAIVQFKRIARINRIEFNMSEKELEELYSDAKKEETFGMMSLFSGWRIAKNTILMAFNWCVVISSYCTLTLLCVNMAGNPFLNIFLQTIVEIPGNVVGMFLGDRIGRKFTNSLSYIISALVCVLVLFLCSRKDDKLELILMILVVTLKFLNAFTFYGVNLQAMETYPTCLRQSGMSLGGVVGNATGILSPFIVYLGKTVNIRYPFYVLLSSYIFGAITIIFLPETLHQKLPDSLDEAKKFGKNQKTWSIPKRRESHILREELEKMNKKKFMP